MSDVATPRTPAAATNARLTASRLSLAAKCPGAFVLPHFGRETPQATRGTRIHARIALFLQDGLWEPHREEDPETRAVLAGMDPTGLLASCSFDGAKDLAAEVPLALDPASGGARILSSSRGHRDYASAPRSGHR